MDKEGCRSLKQVLIRLRDRYNEDKKTLLLWNKDIRSPDLSKIIYMIKFDIDDLIGKIDAAIDDIDRRIK